MFFPQSNAYHQAVDLSSFWDFRFNPEDIGKAASGGQGFSNARPITVPANWNNQDANECDNFKGGIHPRPATQAGSLSIEEITA